MIAAEGAYIKQYSCSSGTCYGTACMLYYIIFVRQNYVLEATKRSSFLKSFSCVNNSDANLNGQLFHPDAGYVLVKMLGV